jgi:hypothetical protein
MVAVVAAWVKQIPFGDDNQKSKSNGKIGCTILGVWLYRAAGWGIDVKRAPQIFEARA